MKEKIGRNLSRPKATYLLSGIAGFALLLASGVLLFLDESGLRNLMAFLLIGVSILLGWINWLAYVLNSRRTMFSIAKKMKGLERGNHRTAESLKREITKGNLQHKEEYKKQSYNVLVSLQDLRLAALEQKEK